MALLVAALDSEALTLGRMRGTALIGQGLDVTIQVQTDPDEGPASLCLEADVFHADARQDPARVQVSYETTPTPQSVNVRVQSSSTVDEPVVTVYLRAGCNQKMSRRYVMLADVLSDQSTPTAVRAPQIPLVIPAAASPSTLVATVNTPVTAGSGRAGSRVAPGVSPAAAGATRTKAPAKAVARPATASATRKPAPAKAATPAAPAEQASEKLLAGRTAGQSRLKLDPLEVLSDRVATLETSTAPAEQAAREARDAQRLQALEASVKNLLVVATRNESSLTDLKARLQQAESERFANPLVYGLGALLLACLAVIGFLFSRRAGTGARAGGNWWSGPSNADHADEAADRAPITSRQSGFSPMSSPSPLTGPDTLSAADQAVQQTQRVGPLSRAAPITQVDVSLVEMSESTFDRLMQSETTHSAVRKPRPVDSGPAPLSPERRLINSDELFDIRQQAEFFVSLGQTDQAVRVLENRIADSGEASPLAYLDLLKIFHSLGLKADFRQVREDFNLLFNAHVPEYSNFDHEGRTLEEYTEVIDSIVKVWGTTERLPAIESWLFIDQQHRRGEAFDLAAFRDLLLLHGVAQVADGLSDELVRATVSDRPRSPFSAGVRPPPKPTGAKAPELTSGFHGKSDDAPLPAINGATTEIDIDLSDLAPDTIPLLADAAPHVAAPDNLIDFDLPRLPAEGGDRPARG